MDPVIVIRAGIWGIEATRRVQTIGGPERMYVGGRSMLLEVIAR